MKTIFNKAYINALLADAAYVDGLTGGMKKADLLKNSEFLTRMTEPQAQFIATNFTVVSAENKSDIPLLGSGLDAVVLLGKPGTVCARLLAINANNDAQYEALTWAA